MSVRDARVYFTKLHDMRIPNVRFGVRVGVGPVEFQLYATRHFSHVGSTFSTPINDVHAAFTTTIVHSVRANCPLLPQIFVAPHSEEKTIVVAVKQRNMKGKLRVVTLHLYITGSCVCKTSCESDGLVLCYTKYQIV